MYRVAQQPDRPGEDHEEQLDEAGRGQPGQPGHADGDRPAGVAADGGATLADSRGVWNLPGTSAIAT